MQTEEETAAAEEPILEEGSEREQVNGMTFNLSPRASAFAQSCTLIYFSAPATSHLVTRNSPARLQHALVFTRTSRFSPPCVPPVQGHHTGPWLGEEPSRGFSERRRGGRRSGVMGYSCGDRCPV